MSYEAVLTGNYPIRVGYCEFESSTHQQELISMTAIEKAVRLEDSILCPNSTYSVEVRNAETGVKLVGKYIAIYETRDV